MDGRLKKFKGRPPVYAAATASQLFKGLRTRLSRAANIPGERGRLDRRVRRPAERFARDQGIAITSKLDVKAARPTDESALQAVDYFLWALQRTFEKREDRFLELLWPQCSLIVDVDDTREAEYGTYYTKQKPLKAAALKNG